MCPNEAAGKVIGHGGETINSIQTKTGAHVRIQPSGEVTQGAARRITVNGAPGAVADAVRLIEDIIRETEIKSGGGGRGGGGGGGIFGGGGGGGGGGQIELPLPVPQDMVGHPFRAP